VKAETARERQTKLGELIHRTSNLYGAYAQSGGSWASLLWDHYGNGSDGPKAKRFLEAVRKTDPEALERRLDAWVAATQELAAFLKTELRAIREEP